MLGYTKKQLEEMIVEQDKRVFQRRLEHLQYLMSIQTDEENTLIPELPLAYYEEARLCWYHGAYVASIVMAQLTFEELLRGHYRLSGINKLRICGKSVDRADFVDLINEALDDGYITKEEADEMNKIRKHFRNPYVHVKDAGIKDGKQDLESPNFIMQGMKARCRNPYGQNVDDEAREVIGVLARRFIPLCRRHNGM